MKSVFNHFPALLLLALFLLPETASAAAASEGEFNWDNFLGPFHNVVLHYPIGFITLVCILEFYGLRHPSDELRKITKLILWLAILSTVLTATLGFARSSDGSYNEQTLSAHKTFGIAVIVLNLFAIGAYGLAHTATNRRLWSGLYRLLLLGTFSVMAITGHKGGDLTHGTDYLTKNAPPAFKELFAEEPGTEPLALPQNSPGSMGKPSQFAQKIWPIFEAKCIKCHGPEKHKGGYRLDNIEGALTAGDSEQKPIVPGAPMESHLVKLILKNEDDDDAMPPSGKDPLTDDEKMAIINWIEKGASYSLVEPETK